MMTADTQPHATMHPKQPWYKILYVQVLIAIALGIVLGMFWPETGAAMKPLGDAFIKLVKMIIAPVIFLTVVTGIAGMSNMKQVACGRQVDVVFHHVFNIGIDYRYDCCQRAATRRRAQH